jgi:hypothetical protein
MFLKGRATPVRSKSPSGLWAEIAYLSAFFLVVVVATSVPLVSIVGSIPMRLSEGMYFVAAVLALGAIGISVFWIVPPLAIGERLLELRRRDREVDQIGGQS